MSASIGVVGGGQLAWMLAAAARELGVELHVQTPRLTDPATRLATSVIQAPLDELAATRRLAARCSAISFENEWLDLDSLAPLEAEGVEFVPQLSALAPLVSKRAQRELLDRLNLPSPRWIPLEDVLVVPAEPEPAAVEAWAAAGPPPSPLFLPLEPEPPAEPRLPEGFEFPVMAKAVSGGYDGRGTLPLHSQQDLLALLEREDPAGWILEEFVTFERELALVACRDRNGTVATYPLVETHQYHQICDWVLAPAEPGHAVEAWARNVAASLLTALDYTGVLAIEFFYGPRGLLINEIAPRTHNSGHYTIEACRTSQFAQQVRIVSGQPLGDAALIRPGALMVNLLGFETSHSAYSERRQALAALPGGTLHWYGKPQSSPGRKLGHLTVLLRERDPRRRAAEARARLADVRGIWPLPPQPTP
jgi:5-(carboxyamino)imidazole ribonucleotide synthase